jgi:tetratricopeptide (TPR) repeat protein
MLTCRDAAVVARARAARRGLFTFREIALPIVRVLVATVMVVASTLLAISAFAQGFPYPGGGNRPDSFLIPDGTYEACSLTQSANERVRTCAAYVNDTRNFHRDNQYRRMNAYLLLGDAFCELGEFNKAVTAYFDGERQNPTSALPAAGRAWAYFKLNKLDLALADANKSIALDPKQAIAYGSRGAIHEAMGNTAEAIKDYQAGVRNKNDYEFGMRALRRLGAAFPSGVVDPEVVRSTPTAPDPGIVFARRRYMSPRQRQNQGPAMGSLIEAITPGSIADRAGIRSGELIVSAEGRRVETGFELRQVLDAARNAAKRSIDVVVMGFDGQRRVTLNW